MRNTLWHTRTAAAHPRVPRPKLAPLHAGINDEYQATDRGDLNLDDIKKKAGGV